MEFFDIFIFNNVKSDIKIKVPQWQVIDIMTYNSYSLQYYSFEKEK